MKYSESMARKTAGPTVFVLALGLCLPFGEAKDRPPTGVLAASAGDQVSRRRSDNAVIAVFGAHLLKNFYGFFTKIVCDCQVVIVVTDTNFSHGGIPSVRDVTIEADKTVISRQPVIEDFEFKCLRTGKPGKQVLF